MSDKAHNFEPHPTRRLLVCRNCSQAVAEGKICCNREGAPLPVVTRDGLILVEVLAVTKNHSVYLAEPRAVLKVMHADVDPLHARLARSSYLLVQSLQSRPGIEPLFPRIHRMSEPGPWPHRVLLEFVEGPTLSTWIAGRRSKERVMAAVSALLRYLRRVHAYNIVLTDLNGDNIKVILTRNKEIDRVIYFDIDVLGVAFERGDGDMLDSISAGTAEYWAPEQVAGERIDCKADIFAVGKMLAKFLTGVVSEAEINTITGPLLRVRPELRPDAREALMHIRQFSEKRLSPFGSSRRLSVYVTAMIAASTAALSAVSYAAIQTIHNRKASTSEDSAISPTPSIEPASVDDIRHLPERIEEKGTKHEEKGTKREEKGTKHEAPKPPVQKPPVKRLTPKLAASPRSSKRKALVNLDK